MKKKNKKDLSELNDEELAALVQGARQAFGSPSLDKFLDDVMRELNDPHRDTSWRRRIDDSD
jgi:uncharacterized protein with von Willebrand factor type A (vWA) domain